MFAAVSSEAAIAECYFAESERARRARGQARGNTRTQAQYICTESATGVNDVGVTNSWRTICHLEAECVAFHSGSASTHSDAWYCRELRHESYGVELLRTLLVSCTPRKRSTSSPRAKPFWAWEVGCTAFRVNTMSLARRACLPLSHSSPLILCYTHAHRYGHSVSTVRAALEVKQVFEQLAEAEKGGVTPEQKAKARGASD
jgi:hypothetical protein